MNSGDSRLTESDSDLARLLDRAAAGDTAARNDLLARVRDPLKALVAPRLRGILATRVDASDVVQDTMVVANDRLDAYLATRPVPFLVWLRELAMERIIDAYRFHIDAQRRSVQREQPLGPLMTDESVQALAGLLADRGVSPSHAVQREETRQAVRESLNEMSETDREVLVLRHLEHLSIREIAQVLKTTENVVKVRHLRALQRLRAHLGDDFRERNG